MESHARTGACVRVCDTAVQYSLCLMLSLGKKSSFILASGFVPGGSQICKRTGSIHRGEKDRNMNRTLTKKQCCIIFTRTTSDVQAWTLKGTR